jgi:hypothetical protein
MHRNGEEKNGGSGEKIKDFLNKKCVILELRHLLELKLLAMFLEVI